jgi:hypothetical protein
MNWRNSGGKTKIGPDLNACTKKSKNQAKTKMCRRNQKETTKITPVNKNSFSIEIKIDSHTITNVTTLSLSHLIIGNEILVHGSLLNLKITK